MKKTDAGAVLKGAAAGLVGGIAACLLMGGFQSLLGALSEKGEKEPLKKNEGDPATVQVAETISEEVFDHHLAESEKGRAGTAIHYTMGGGSGLIYGIAAELAPVSTVGAGLGFGTAVWLLADGVALPALGLSKPLNKLPLSANAGMLLTNLVYGLTTDVVRRTLRGLM